MDLMMPNRQLQRITGMKMSLIKYYRRQWRDERAMKMAFDAWAAGGPDAGVDGGFFQGQQKIGPGGAVGLGWHYN